MVKRAVTFGSLLNWHVYDDNDPDHSPIPKAGSVTAPIFVDAAPVDNEDVLRLNELGGLTPSAIAVSDITNPTELGSYTGSGSSLALVYEVGGGVNKATLYVWDSAVASGANSPFVVAGLSGYWIAIGGTYNVAGPRRGMTSVTGNYTVLADDDILLIDATAGNITVTLPTAVGIKGKVYTTKRIDNSSNTVTIDGDGTETIDGSASYSLFYLEFVELGSDNANWWSVG
jgi:hypothetical protein